MASRRVLIDFTDDALTISVGSLFQNKGSPTFESVLAMAGTTSLLAELIGVAAKPSASWLDEGGLRGEFQIPLVILNVDIRSSQYRLIGPISKVTSNEILSCGDSLYIRIPCVLNYKEFSLSGAITIVLTFRFTQSHCQSLYREWLVAVESYT